MFITDALFWVERTNTLPHIAKLDANDREHLGVIHLTREELEAGLAHIQASPRDDGILEMIVCRPRTNEREVLEEGRLDCDEGLVGDNWSGRGTGKDAEMHRDMQLNIMNSRVTELVAQGRGRWPLAGDQLYLDLDLGDENLPPGTRLKVGGAVIEVTAVPHTGCQKFSARYGLDATRFVNSRNGRRLNLRGVNARVVASGTIRVGDVASKVPS